MQYLSPHVLRDIPFPAATAAVSTYHHTSSCHTNKENNSSSPAPPLPPAILYKKQCAFIYSPLLRQVAKSDLLYEQTWKLQIGNTLGQNPEPSIQKVLENK